MRGWRTHSKSTIIAPGRAVPTGDPGIYAGTRVTTMNGILTVWVITWRMAWPLVLAAAGLLIISLLSYAPRFASHVPPVRAVSVPLVAPLLLIVWSGGHWATPRERIASVSSAYSALSVLCLLVAIAWPILFRRARGVGFVVAAGVVGFLYSLAAWFIGGMAISNVWL